VSFGTFAWVWLTAALTLALMSESAPAAGLNILDTRYTTVVHTYSFEGGEYNASRTNVSGSRIIDSLFHPVTGQLEAQADADLFRVTAYTAADGHDLFRAGSLAISESQIRFSLSESITLPLTIDFSGWGQWYFSGGYVRLVDLTSDLESWNYWWQGFSGNVPWIIGGEDPTASASVTVPTVFQAGSIYALTLRTWTGSNPPDTERIRIQVVPEPSSLLVLSFGVLFWGIRLNGGSPRRS
jgi:hypothetical protein